MSFQWIIDNAESISINRKKIVGSTTARDGTTRAVSRGGQTWRFDVKLPDGPRWTDIRQFITQAESLDRTTAANIQLNNAGHSWLVGYQGDTSSYTSFVANFTQNATSITLTSAPAQSSGFRFRAGDFIQLGSSGRVYTVAADVAYNSNTVTLHRPIIEGSASGITLRVAENCVFNVICVQFPEWTLFARDQVSWSGPFIFTENLV
jgi:hypothetical protein